MLYVVISSLCRKQEGAWQTSTVIGKYIKLFNSFLLNHNLLQIDGKIYEFDNDFNTEASSSILRKFERACSY